jgi:hypothetical protein
VDVLQQKLHLLHATDASTLRRSYATVAQHVQALKLEAAVRLPLHGAATHIVHTALLLMAYACGMSMQHAGACSSYVRAQHLLPLRINAMPNALQYARQHFKLNRRLELQ